MLNQEDPKTDRVPFKEDTQPVEEKSEQTPEPEKIFEKATSYMDNMDYHKVAEFFDIAYEDRRDTSLFEKLGLIQEWAMTKSKSSDIIDALSQVNELKKRLGLQMKGRDLVTRLHRYLRLSMDRERLEKEMKLIAS